MYRTLLPLLLVCCFLHACRRTEAPPSAPPERASIAQPQFREITAGPLEVVHASSERSPIGVAVSRAGRIFLNYPRWEDPIDFTVAELRDGTEIPFPTAELNSPTSADHLYSVQAIAIDPLDRLWLLDTGSRDFQPIRGPRWPKLVGVDLSTNTVVKTIRFPEDVVLATTYLNDVRFDLRRGKEGFAFITDSSLRGPNAIIVVDLASGKSWRKLHEHESVKADSKFLALMDGRPLMLRPKDGAPRPALVGADGIALSADGERLFFCPLSSRDLYSVSVEALVDPALPDNEVIKTITAEKREFASDGLEADDEGRIYLTNWEHNSLVVRYPDGRLATLVSDGRLLWPDSLDLARDGYLYVTASQIHRLRKFNEGRDRRSRPFQLFRIKVGAQPVELRRP